MKRAKKRKFRLAVPALNIGHGQSLRPTWYGFVYLGMVAALLLGSINENNNLGFLLSFLLGGIFLMSLRETRNNLLGIDILSCQAQAAFAGGEAKVNLCLGACATHYGLALAIDAGKAVPGVRVAPGEKSVELSLPAPRRGWQRLRQITLTSEFPFGLVECRRVLPVEGRFLVYPKPVPSPYVSAAIGEEIERGETVANAGLDFKHIRDYQPGDKPGRIHWRSLARGQKLHVSQFDEDESGGALFSLTRLPGNDVEYKLSCLCHMVLAAAGHGRRFGLDLGGQIIKPERGGKQRKRCLEALALYGRGEGGKP